MAKVRRKTAYQNQDINIYSTLGNFSFNSQNPTVDATGPALAMLLSSTFLEDGTDSGPIEDVPDLKGVYYVDGVLSYYDPPNYTEIEVGSSSPVVETMSLVFTIESKDGTTPIATGAGTAKWVAPWDGTINHSRVSNGLGVVAGTLTVDLNKNGTTTFTTQANRPKVVTGNANGVGATAVPDVTTFVAGDYFTVDLDGINATDQAVGNQITVQALITRTA